VKCSYSREGSGATTRLTDIWQGVALEEFQARSKQSSILTVARFAALTAAFSIAIGAHVGHAESLRSALAAAYKFNPDIEAERANLRATDEGVAQAHSGYRPNVSASADVGAVKTRTRPGGTSARNPSGYQLNINQNLFDGFRTTNSVNQSEANVRAGRAALHSTEQSVLLLAATSYMNVVRDQAIVRLRDNNVTVLSKNLRATQDRFKAGEVTRTDVAQSRARRAGAVSALDLARANLKTSRANYERIIGHPPNNLRNGNVPERLLPKTQKDSLRRAISESPSVVAALYREQAARHNVEVVWGELLPSVSVDASFSKRHQPGSGVSSVGTSSVIGTLSVPIYSGGIVRSRVRQAKQLHLRQIQLVAQARTQARESAVTAWSALQAARAQLRSDHAQVEANGIALSGVREEEKVGQRTLLDVLDAEQELLDAQVSLVQTKRDLVVNAYALVAATGRLTARELNLTSKVYDPEEHYFDVRRKWFGISITHQDGRQEKVDLWDKHGKHRTYK
jgi:outer membrane protein